MRACAREKGLCCHFSAFSPKKIGATQKGCVVPPYLCTRICEKAGAVARKCFDGSARGRRFESGCPLQDMVQRLERWLERPCACCLAFPAFGPDAVGRRYFVLVAFLMDASWGKNACPQSASDCCSGLCTWGGGRGAVRCGTWQVRCLPP